MRALAEFVMKGRVNAVGVAGLAIGTVMFAWIGAAVAALVMLRKGVAEGAYVVFWALLPGLAVAKFGGDIGPMTMLMGAAVSAFVLRQTQSWTYSMLSAVGFSLLMALMLVQFGDAYLASVAAMIQPMLDQIKQQLPKMLDISHGDIAAMLSISTGLWSILALMLARWWQGMLYNPGGFQAEFWRFRVTPMAVVILVMVMLLLGNSGEQYRFWGVVCFLPLVVAGIALVHGSVGRLGLGRIWLFVFYFALLSVSPLWALLILAAVIDSWFDIRRRLPDRSS